jgi:hypothetical protein
MMEVSVATTDWSLLLFLLPRVLSGRSTPRRVFGLRDASHNWAHQLPLLLDIVLVSASFSDDTIKS